MAAHFFISKAKFRMLTVSESRYFFISNYGSCESSNPKRQGCTDHHSWATFSTPFLFAVAL